MQLQFCKIHGAGNDFIVADDLSGEIELTPEQVAALCDRHFGIGADGVILVRQSPHADCAAYMHYINADGTLAEMCGNGVRCFAKYLVDHGFVAADAPGFIADTKAGKRPISFEVNAQGELTQATVDMGEPADIIADEDVYTPFGTYTLTQVNMGNPHAVIFDDPGLVATVGPHLEARTDIFPHKANIEFAVVDDAGSAGEPALVRMRVFERGVGETLACGTGACATAVAGAVTGRTARKVTVKLLGGDLLIDWQENNHVMMTGPAVTVFEGTIEIG